MHTSELCYHQAKETYARRGMVAVHFNNRDNTPAGSGKYTLQCL